jgi:hypothetical protein
VDFSKEELERARAEWEYSLDGNPDGNTNNTGYPNLADTITLTSTNYSNTTVAANGPYTYTTATGISSPSWSTATSGKLTLLGDDADLVINGVSLKQVLEERLNVLIPNPELEKEWAQLKELGDKYREVEADLIEKAKIWKALNK